jgi:hypothetical protein
MLERLIIPGVPSDCVPRLYVAADNSDVRLAKDNGLPYVRWSAGAKDLLIQVLRPALEKKFPYIEWAQVLGRRKNIRTTIVRVPGGENEEPSRCECGDSCIADIAISERSFTGDAEVGSQEMLSISEYLDDASCYINLESLQRLELLPSFLGDIVDNVKKNLVAPLHWREGWNKKKRCCLGNYHGEHQLPNLIIIDVSSSIPRGISATMLVLADTLRSQIQADLIITGGISLYFKYGEELPTPDEIRRRVPAFNESQFFRKIVKGKLHKQYGHIISFGDQDDPGKIDTDIRCKVVHHYHTWSPNDQTGYAKCFHAERETFDNTWCQILRKE